MRILSIDPGSNRIETSTTGIVLLDNAKLVDYWVVPFGTKNFLVWFKNIGSTLEYDVVVVEKYEARDNDYSRDNSVLETNLILQRNAGYQSDIPNELLKALNLWKFEKSHHNDVRAAARLGLFYAMRNDIEEVIQDIGRIATKEMAS